MIRLSLSLYAVVMGWMTSLSPSADHSALAWAIASQAHGEGEAALMTSLTFRESSFDNHAVGDHGRSVCAAQIHGGPRELLESPDACISVAFTMLRESVRVDRKNPVAFYARGPRFSSEEARRISRDRVALAKRLLAGAP